MEERLLLQNDEPGIQIISNKKKGLDYNQIKHSTRNSSPPLLSKQQTLAGSSGQNYTDLDPSCDAAVIIIESDTDSASSCDQSISQTTMPEVNIYIYCFFHIISLVTINFAKNNLLSIRCLKHCPFQEADTPLCPKVENGHPVVDSKKESASNDIHSDNIKTQKIDPKESVAEFITEDIFLPPDGGVQVFGNISFKRI